MTTMDERANAMQTAGHLLAHGDHDVDDLIAVADWLLTGSCDAALAMSAQRASNYQESQGETPDAMRWIPSGRDELKPLVGDDE